MNASTALAGAVLDELARCGTTDVVLAPGSRSAPLAYAAAGLPVRLHVRIDERSAGFLALGIARTSHRPVAVVITSGTAVANLHPAVLEAHHSGVPLVVLSADRPARLRGTGANQTTTQPGLYGVAARLAADVAPGHPGGEAGQAQAWRALAAKAFWTAAGRLGDRPGPVHLNLQLDEPLVPDAADGWSQPAPPRQPALQPGPPPAPQPVTVRGDVRGVVVAGDDAGPAARVLAESAGWPLLAEPTSGARTGRHALRSHRLLLADATGLAEQVDHVVVVGHPTLSRPVTRLLTGAPLTVVRGRHGWSDPGLAAGQVADAVRAEGRADAGWLERWRALDEERSAHVDGVLARWPGLTPQEVAGAVAHAVPAGGLLFVGASNPVRDLDLVLTPYPVGERRLLCANRGLAGIDGSVGSAVGAALGRPHSTRALALLGDLTFLHDANGLLLGPGEPRPDLTVVVVNDDGGSVFATLEPGRDADEARYERLFATRTGADLASLCAATRTPHWRVDSLAELRHALASPQGGIEVVEAAVSVRTRADRRALEAAL